MNLYYYESYTPDKYSSFEYYNPAHITINYFLENENGEMISIGKKPDKLVNGKLVPDLDYVMQTKHFLNEGIDLTTDQKALATELTGVINSELIT